MNATYGRNPRLWNIGFLLFNIVALALVVPIVASLWNLGPGLPPIVSAIVAIAAGFVYCFLILLLNKFLIQNRVDRLPLRIARWSFCAGCAVILAMTLLLAFTENTWSFLP